MVCSSEKNRAKENDNVAVRGKWWNWRRSPKHFNLTIIFSRSHLSVPFFVYYFFTIFLYGVWFIAPVHVKEIFSSSFFCSLEVLTASALCLCRSLHSLILDRTDSDGKCKTKRKQKTSTHSGKKQQLKLTEKESVQKHTMSDTSLWNMLLARKRMWIFLMFYLFCL